MTRNYQVITEGRYPIKAWVNGVDFADVEIAHTLRQVVCIKG